MAKKNLSKTSFRQVALEKISKATYEKAYAALQDLPDKWYKFIETKMDEPKSGKEYWNSMTGKMYTASKEGEYPARKTPKGSAEWIGLLDLLKVSMGTKNYKNKFIRVYIHSGAYYTQYLEDQGRKLIEASKEDFFDIALKEIEEAKGKNTPV